MKKLTLILLSLIMCFSAFACDGETDTSNNASTSSNAESSAVVSNDETTSDNEASTENETSLPIESETTSANSSDESSQPEEDPVFDINNVLYFTGKYYTGLVDVPEKEPGIDIGRRSPMDIDDEHYYYIGFLDERYEMVISDLEKCGVVFGNDEENVFIEGNAPYPITESMTDAEKTEAKIKNVRHMFADTDLSGYTDEELELLYDYHHVYAIGYVNKDVLRKSREENFYFEVKVLPAPDDDERFLTVIDHYRELYKRR